MVQNSDEISDLDLIKKIYQFMGSTTTSIENIEKSVAEHIKSEETSLGTMKSMISDNRSSIYEIKATLAHGFKCPHVEAVENTKQQIMQCIAERGKLFGERRYIYGALGTIIGFLGIIVKIIWDLHHHARIISEIIEK